MKRIFGISIFSGLGFSHLGDICWVETLKKHHWFAQKLFPLVCAQDCGNAAVFLLWLRPR